MLIQVNTDNHIQGDERLTEYTKTSIEVSLGHLADHITRVEVHFADENGETKSVGDDKRCMLEARMAGKPPLSVTHHAATVKDALSGALTKLSKVLREKEDRRRDKHATSL